MDYINGHTFEQLIFQDGAKFTIVQSLVITKQLLEQIVQLHNDGIVHRDLRIPNILFVHQQLHIIDFGLATTYQKQIDISTIKNPKRAENHISDLYFVGHFCYFYYTQTTSQAIKRKSPAAGIEVTNRSPRFS